MVQRTLIARALAARQCVTADPSAALAQFLRHYEADPTALTKTFPGVSETLERLQAIGLTLAICNEQAVTPDSDHSRASRHQSLFRASHRRRHVALPEARSARAAEVLNVFGTPPAATIMVGDSEVDAATAHAANVPFILMTYGYHRGPIDGISSIATLDHFAELATLLHA